MAVFNHNLMWNKLRIWHIRDHLFLVCRGRLQSSENSNSLPHIIDPNLVVVEIQ